MGFIFFPLVLCLLVVQLVRLQFQRRRYPPGPTPLPFVGSLWHPKFLRLNREHLTEISKIYGNIFTLWFGPYPVIILQGFQAVKEGLTAHPEDLAGRPLLPLFKAVANNKGILLATGRTWKHQRRFSMATLKSLGMGKSTLQYQIQEEAENLVEEFRKSEVSAREGKVSKKIKMVAHTIKALDKEGNFTCREEFIPFSLGARSTKNQPKSPYNEKNLVQNIFDLFMGGTETSGTTFNWALLYMVLYPDIQAKVQKEIDTLLPPGQSICYEDCKKLPYTNAVVHKIQRFSNIIAIGVPRYCIRDTMIQKFLFRKGSIFFPNMASPLYDANEWETPLAFNPNHFLDKEGNFTCREAFIPFSLGHRACLGENLAKTEIFLFFTNLVQMFNFHLADRSKDIKFDAIWGGTLHPHFFEISAIPC
ncbi:LOW QUALITY PROTEIN: cytochrome P450 2D20-like [Protobothrops mucrosquamatus]|uniref:LOW QUALITY PROTEIN: cytochrome P450 2D20-like n=1 Tax=Protobothrops mucrosquamatus TaxID=103944 RepID=UPI0010FBA8E5|nr:LOW QUALITY PROTEIN: cytochrome P450 2D20-like [Protobothrops mucrosquamatus]